MNGGDQECLLLIIQTCHLNLLTFLFMFNLHSKCLWFKLFGILTGVYNWIKLTNPRNVVRNKVAKLLTYPPDFEHFFIEAALQSVLATACPAYLQTKPCMSTNVFTEYLCSYWLTHKIWFVNVNVAKSNWPAPFALATFCHVVYAQAIQQQICSLINYIK